MDTISSALGRRTGVAALFEEAARRRPAAPALITGRRTLTFSELSTRAGELASFLRDRGAGPGGLVLLKGEPAPEAVIAILAVLRTGAGYVAVEPGTPVPWIDAVLASAEPSVILTVDREDDPRWQRMPAPGTYGERPPEPVPDNAEATMYVVFTAGSSGRPKGVVTSHRACLARLAPIWRTYPPGPDERACLSAALTSSDSVRQVFGSLLEGTPVVVPRRGSRRDPVRLLSELSRHRVTRMLVTPSLLRSLLALAEDPATELGGVRRWFLSGEPVTAGLLRYARAALPGARFTNLYATTETPVTFGDVTGEEEVVTVGRPSEGTELLLLDSRMRPVPPGEVGEVFVGGEALTSGYLGDPEATRAAYLPHPGRPGRRLYRTGDLGRLTPDGELELRGRRDGQLQLRGHRVEAEAVEEALRDHPGIAEAAVALQAMPEGRQALVAFCAPRPGGRPDPADVLRHVRGRLPHYMVPARCVLLDRVPLSRNGKLDRRRLPDLDTAPAADGEVAEDVPPVRRRSRARRGRRRFHRRRGFTERRVRRRAAPPRRFRPHRAGRLHHAHHPGARAPGRAAPGPDRAARGAERGTAHRRVLARLDAARALAARHLVRHPARPGLQRLQRRQGFRDLRNARRSGAAGLRGTSGRAARRAAHQFPLPGR
jgi:amino acid adenylation domain-containing protein